MNDVRSINCTQCGAPLELHGGHRTRSLNCAYCGAVMDSHEGYKVVEQFHDTLRPHCPLHIGMQGVLKDVEFTIIGLIQYQTEEGDTWIDLQLYSPTHGYHWLSDEQGHFIFSRRVRDIPKPAHISNFKLKAPVFLGKQRFYLYEQYRAKVQYVEGELTWIAKQGNWLNITEATAPPVCLSYENSVSEEDYYKGHDAHTEKEYYYGEYFFPNDIYQRFSVEKSAQDKPEGIHMAQPYQPGLTAAMGQVGGYFFWVGLLALFVILFMNADEQPRLKYHFNQTELSTPTLIPFKVEDPQKLLEFRISVDRLTNHWVAYEMVVQKEEENVLIVEKEIEFYEGRDSDGYWSEGSREARALFKLPAAGEYSLSVLFDGGSQSTPPPLFVELYEGVVVVRYFLLLMALSLLFYMWKWFHRRSHENRRWEPVTEDEDD